jgi:hypothetical protein
MGVVELNFCAAVAELDGEVDEDPAGCVIKTKKTVKKAKSAEERTSAIDGMCEWECAVTISIAARSVHLLHTHRANSKN